MLQDVRAVGMAALQLPRVLRQRECGTTWSLAERNARYPMLLVHGYAATDSVWTPLRRALGQAGRRLRPPDGIRRDLYLQVL